jgi:hypothetical protein
MIEQSALLRYSGDMDVARAIGICGATLRDVIGDIRRSSS